MSRKSLSTIQSPMQRVGASNDNFIELYNDIDTINNAGYQTSAQVQQAINNAIANVYKFMGSDSVANLNAYVVSQSGSLGDLLGYVYNITDNGNLNNYSGTTAVISGDNVAFVYVSDTDWHWDKLAGVADLSNYVDKTSNQTIGGTKTFTSRPKSAEVYTKLSYISSPAGGGFPYIRTGVLRGVNYTNKLTCVLDGYFTESQTYGFCGYDSGGQLGQKNGKWSTENDGLGTTNVNCIGSTNRATVTQVLDFSANNNKLYINGTMVAGRNISNTAYSQTNDYPLFVAYSGSYTYNPAKLVLFSFKMYDGDTTGPLIRDYIPVKTANNEIGLLDLVENKFYRNQGTTAFTAGSVVGTISVAGDLLVSSDVSLVGLTNDYNDLDNKPTIPTKVSQLTNDSGYITNNAISNMVTTDTTQKISGSKSFTTKPTLAVTPRLPNTYQEVKYIGATGSQYINTGYKTSSEKLKVEFACSFPSGIAGMSLFGSNSPYNLVPYGTGGNIVGHWVGSSGGIMSVVYDTDYNEVVYNLNNGTISCTLNGTTTSTTYAGTIINSVNFNIFGKNGGGNSAERGNGYNLYYLKLYDNDVLVRNLVPCYRISDGVIGLYDLVNSTFYTNAGSGTFNKGANVESSPFVTEADLSPVAISGDYNDLINTPVIPSGGTQLYKHTFNDGNGHIFVIVTDDATAINDNDMPTYYMSKGNVYSVSYCFYDSNEDGWYWVPCVPATSTSYAPGSSYTPYKVAISGVSYTWGTTWKTMGMSFQMTDTVTAL